MEMLHTQHPQKTMFGRLLLATDWENRFWFEIHTISEEEILPYCEWRAFWRFDQINSGSESRWDIRNEHFHLKIFDDVIALLTVTLYVQDGLKTSQSRIEIFISETIPIVLAFTQSFEGIPSFTFSKQSKRCYA